MSNSTDLRYVRVSVTKQSLNRESRRWEAHQARVALQVTTQGGSVRYVPLDKDQLAKLISDAAHALRSLIEEQS